MKKDELALFNAFAADFKDRVVGFGTYDIGLPNGATHWVGLTGEDTQDHLMLYDKMEKKDEGTDILEETQEFLEENRAEEPVEEEAMVEEEPKGLMARRGN